MIKLLTRNNICDIMCLDKRGDIKIMRKWKCVYTTDTNKYTFTVGKIYESDDKGYGIKGDDGFIFDVTTASLLESLTSGHGFVVTKFEEVFEEEIMKQYREVDRKPVVGDMVKIVKLSDYVPKTNGIPDYEVGDILNIKEFTGTFAYRYANGIGDNNIDRVLFRDEFIVVEEITQFTKSDLQEGDIVVLRNGERYVLFNNRLVSDIRSSISIKQYSDNLRINEFGTSYLDIMQVYRNNKLIFSRIEPTERELQIKQLQDEMDKIKVKLEELR